MMRANEKVTILLVDDEAEFRELVALRFRRSGFDVVEAESGNSAIRALQGNPEIDVIVSDIRMPDGTGVDLLNFVQSRMEKRPVVFLTTGYADLTVEEARGKGATNMIFKPYDMKSLLEEIDRALVKR